MRTEPGKGPKYAPAREDGLKPWFAEIFEWGRRRTKIIYADTATNARYKAIGRMRYTTAKVRRANSGGYRGQPCVAAMEPSFLALRRKSPYVRFRSRVT